MTHQDVRRIVRQTKPVQDVRVASLGGKLLPVGIKYGDLPFRVTTLVLLQLFTEEKAGEELQGLLSDSPLHLPLLHQQRKQPHSDFWAPIRDQAGPRREGMRMVMTRACPTSDACPLRR